jgi:glycosyltransferase involved in cell wall biosynthesis
MTEAPALSIVIPVFNGARTIGTVAEAISGLDVPGGVELVLVNDGSADDSGEVCAKLVHSLPIATVLIDHSRNFGEHNAIMTGLRHARGTHVITMDDDLQNPPSEILRLYRCAIETGKDVVYGRYKQKRHSVWRNLGSRFANWCANLLLDKPKDLYLSSFRCLSRFIVDKIAVYDGPYPYVDGLITQNTDSFASIEVEHLPRAAGRSNYNLKRLIRLWLNITLNFSIKPLRICTFLGLFASLAGMVGILYVLVDYFIHGASAPGWGTLMIVLLMFSGIQLILLGIVGEYLGRLFLTANRRPQAVIREVIRADRQHNNVSGS